MTPLPDKKAFAARHPPYTPGQLLERAIAEDQSEVVLEIVRNSGIDINRQCDLDRVDSVSPLMTALRAGRARMVGLIVGVPGFDLALSLPEYERWSWVRTAPLEVLQRYLEIPNSDVNQQDGNGKTLLHEVVYDLGSQDKLRALLSRPGIEVDKEQVDGTTPLYRAALAGNTAAVPLLLESGANINNRNNDNLWTILMVAVAQGHTAIVELLLSRPGLNVNAADDIQNTALHIAAERGRTRIVELLLQRPDVEVNNKNHLGWTPLSKAAFAGHAEVLKRLLKRPEIEVNAVDQQEQTALFHAVSAGHLEIVRQLVADPRTDATLRNTPAQLSALDMAKALGHSGITQLLGAQGREP